MILDFNFCFNAFSSIVESSKVQNRDISDFVVPLRIVQCLQLPGTCRMYYQADGDLPGVVLFNKELWFCQYCAAAFANRTPCYKTNWVNCSYEQKPKVSLITCKTFYCPLYMFCKGLEAHQ